mmetsp:Transcript_103090/g.321242  ORF Transcript_103090/g.321242 Transcript_103090/m.321242 type:complete len:150 (-) Transcript_103090:31-480(-)
MAVFINVKRTSDGSGRDTYIGNEDVMLHGKQQLGKYRVHSHRPFKHWELRGHPPLSARERRCHTPSIRRGGPGWLPSVHAEDLRRTQEAWGSVAGKEPYYPLSARSSPRPALQHAHLVSQLQVALQNAHSQPLEVPGHRTEAGRQSPRW